MSRAAEVTLLWGGEERLFRLPIGRIRAIQEKCDAGLPELLRRYITQSWMIDDVREVILQGLLGGGLDNQSATKAVMAYFDDTPIQPHIMVAQAVVAAAIVGVDDEDLGEPEGEAEAATSPSPEESSASHPSTEAGSPQE
jgi:hypothetical protein